MKELIGIGVGQAGIQISQSLLQLYLAEHNLTNQGTLAEQTQISQDEKDKIKNLRKFQNLSALFQQDQKSKFKSRLMLVDTEPDVINEFQKSKIGNILNSQYLMAGKESANNFGKAYYYNNNFYYTNQFYQDYLRKIAQKCQTLEGFILTHGIQGGTGSGVLTILMQKISQMFPKSHRTNILVNYDLKSSTNVIGPYNSLLSLSRIQEYSSLTISVDNASLHRIADKGLGIDKPNFSNINSLISQIVSSYTLGNRFSNNVLQYSLKSIQANLTPYPRIHSVIPSMSPLIYHDSSFKWSSIYSQKLLMTKCYDKSGQFCHKNQPKQRMNKIIATSILARGELDARKLLLAGREIRKKETWVDFILTGMKICLSDTKMRQYHLNQIQKQMKTSMISLSSSTQMSDVLAHLNYKFDKMYSRLAFVHSFVSDGMQIGQFSQARDDLAALQKDYQDWGGGYSCYGEHQGYDQQEDVQQEQQEQEQVQEDVN